MYCPSCNQYNDDRSRFCSFCGAQLHLQQSAAPNDGDYQAQPYTAPNSGSYEAQQSNQQAQSPDEGSYQSQQSYQQAQSPDEGSYQSQQSYQQAQSPDSGSYQSQPYQQPYQPPYQPPFEPTQPITMATPVVAIILNIVFFNIIGLVLSVLSLVNFNNYISERNRGGIDLAETYKHKSKTFATIADILAAVTFVLIVIAVVAFVVFGVMRGGNGVVEFNFDSNGLPPEFFGVIGW